MRRGWPTPICNTGNVLLVPTPGGQFSLKLIDYDGIYVPAFAGRPSGELGHSAYQHPQRMREGTYNAEVDRFSHLVICSAVHALTVGLTFKPRELWDRFNNGDNLLFRESDFARPQDSELFRLLWSVPNRELRAWVGRLALACRSRLEETALLGDVFSQGKVKPLTNEEARAADALLRPASASVDRPLNESQRLVTARQPAALPGTSAVASLPGTVVASQVASRPRHRMVLLALVAVVLPCGRPYRLEVVPGVARATLPANWQPLKKRTSRPRSRELRNSLREERPKKMRPKETFRGDCSQAGRGSGRQQDVGRGNCPEGGQPKNWRGEGIGGGHRETAQRSCS